MALNGNIFLRVKNMSQSMLIHTFMSAKDAEDGKQTKIFRYMFLNELKEKYKLDSIEELSEREWVMEWDLKEEYRLLRRRIHLCGKCKCAMHKSSDDERAKLVCPDCGGNPEEPGYCNMLNWD